MPCFNVILSTIMVHVMVFIVFLLFVSCSQGNTSSLSKDNVHNNKAMLYDKILKNYDNRIIPKCTNDPVNVSIQLALREIVDVYEQLEIIKLQIWIRLSWFDCNLVWNESEYGNTSRIVVPNSDIWIPDLILLDGVDTIANMPNMKQYRALVHSDGTVQFNFQTVVHTVCHLDIKYYPYDIQMCDLSFMSWIYNVNDVDIRTQSDSGDLTHFSYSQEFIATKVLAKNITENYQCCGGDFSKVTFTIKMRRRPVFFMITTVLPFFVVTIISFAGFALPSISGEKITFHTTILLAIIVFLLLVQQEFPSTSETFPRIAIYFSISMMLSCVSCVMSAIVMYIFYNDLSGKKMHRWVKLIFLDWLGKLMRIKERNLPYDMKKPNDENKLQLRPKVEQEKLRKSRKSRKSLKELEGTSISITEFNGMYDIESLSTRFETEEASPKPKTNSNQPSDLTKTNANTDGSDSAGDGIELNRNDLEPSTRRMNDWELMAYTLDRFFTVFYVSMTVLNAMVFFIVMKSNEAVE